MSWDFSTDPEYAEQLDVGRDVRARGVRAARPDHRGVARPQRPGAPGAHPAAAADRQGARPLGDAPRAAPRRAGLRAGEARAAERDPRAVGVRADRVRVAGTRLRQQRDPRSLRHPGAQGPLPRAAARQPHRVVLLDDRAPGRRRPEGVHDRGGAGRRRVGHQRREVVLVVRRHGGVPHRDGGDRSRCAAVRAPVDVRGAAGDAGHQRPAQRRSRLRTASAAGARATSATRTSACPPTTCSGRAAARSSSRRRGSAAAASTTPCAPSAWCGASST